MLNRESIGHKYELQGGFTLVELIIVIAILGVLATFIVPNYINYIYTARLASDKSNVKTLNEATVMFAYDSGKPTTEVFGSISSDGDKMILLLDRGYIGEIPTPKLKNTSFVFSRISGFWTLSDSVLFYSDFSSNTNVKTLKGNWDTINGQLTPTKTGENRALFNNTSGTDYNIKINATYLSGSAGQSGYGIYYRATDSANISGYCFQFDPGAGNKFLVRTWRDGTETMKSIASVDMKSVLGSSFNPTAPHDIDIEVIGTQHVIKVDGVQVLKFSDSTFTEGCVGVRTWYNTKAEFSEVTVTNR